jgi:trans-aconitate methyltransferase
VGRVATEPIYQRPDDYDLEHEGDVRDVRFYSALARRLQPSRVLELACGTARVTCALARTLPDAQIVGLDSSPEMLARGRQRIQSAPAELRGRVLLIEGDMRYWRSELAFDLVVVPCGSVAHLVTMADRLRTWSNVYTLLRAGGSFAVDVRMPDLATLADSQRLPPRAPLLMDVDGFGRPHGRRLLRCTATMYEPHEQSAHIRYFYDRLDREDTLERFVSDEHSHVYFPSEVELLFAVTGFTAIERYGDYDFSPLGPASSVLITVAQRP